MIAADVAAVLGRYDDETWIALANRGLLRRARKDLETLEVRVVSETQDGVEIAVGDRTVRMGVTGPGDAHCSCPSAVTCQHIITAGLWLASAAPEPALRPEAAVVPDADRLHGDLMAIDAAALTAHAGLPGYRWAHQMLDDQATPPAITRGSYLTVTFERPALTVRYLGGGVDGLVLDQPVPDDGPRSAAVPVALAGLRALIEAEAQRGCAGVVPGVIHDRVARAHRNLRHAGLSLFAEPAAAVSPPETLLRSLFLVQQVERVLSLRPGTARLGIDGPPPKEIT